MRALWFQLFFSIVKKIETARQLAWFWGLGRRQKRLKDVKRRVVELTI